MTVIDKELIDFANELVDESGRIIAKYYRNLDNIEYKEDESPVTVADREVEQSLRAMIEAKYPDHDIEGEEFGIIDKGSKYRWYIDPIDGTSAFIIGKPSFGTLISLLIEGEPVLGIIDQPISKERWVGVKGQDTVLNSEKANVRSCAKLQDAVLGTTGPNYFSTHQFEKFSDVSAKVKYTVYGGDCYNYGLLSAGHLDLVIEAELKPHDYYAFVPIIEGAGGIITDWDGNRINMETKGDVVASGDRQVHESVLETLKN